MRTSFLILSVLAHGGAIAVVAYASATARPARERAEVAIRQQLPVPEAAAQPQHDTTPPVRPEPVRDEFELPPEPIELPPPLPERRPPVEVIEPPLVMPAAIPQASLARIKPPSETTRLETTRPETTGPEPTRPEPTGPAVEAVATPADRDVVEVTTVPPPEPPVAAVVTASPLAENEPPPYPKRERRLGREGTVIVTASVDPAGHVTAVALKEASPYPGLNRAALAAVRKWRFSPTTENGVPVADDVDVPVVFQLRAPPE